MKKLFFAVCFLSTLAYAGPENYSAKDKEVMQPAPPPCGFYRDREWDLSIWGAHAFSGSSTWGGGVDVKYFWSKSFGIGFEGFALDRRDNFGGAALVTLTLRYPVGCSHLAPYVFAGAGVLMGGRDENNARSTGQAGGGLECRLTPRIGLIADFSWNFVGERDSNFGMVRAGVNFAF